MGNGASRLDRYAGTYEKSFERIEKDVERLKSRTAARARRKASLSTWASAAVALAIAVAVGIIYQYPVGHFLYTWLQVQQQPAGKITHQQHLLRVVGALVLPVAAYAARWLLVAVLNVVERRDNRKLRNLETAKRNMVKELKDMTRFDKIKSLIDKYDPDAQPLTPPAALAGLRPTASLPESSLRQQLLQQQQQRSQQVVPALLMKSSGQVAGAAAYAMAGAGKALMPVFDKLANSLISENPMLLEDLRNSKLEGLKAQVREGDALLDSCNAKLENISLKQRLEELEQQLDLPPSHDSHTLEEQRQQLMQQAQDVQRVHQQLQERLQQQLTVQQGTPALLLEGARGANSAVAATETADAREAADATAPFAGNGGNGGGTGSGSWPGVGLVVGEVSRQEMQQAGAISAPETPCTSAGAAAETSLPQAVEAGSNDSGGTVKTSTSSSSAMGEGLQENVTNEAVDRSGTVGELRQRKGGAAVKLVLRQ